MTVELDYMEYANDGAVQAAYPTSEEFEAIVDQEESGGAETSSAVYGASGTFEKVAQEFQVSAGGISCPKVALHIQKVGSPTDNIVARIETDNGGLPSGNLVHADATKSLAASGISADYGWVEFEFPNPVALAQSTAYHLVLQRSGSRDTGDFIRPKCRRYISPNGGYEVSTSGSWAGNNDISLFFRVYKNVDSLQDYEEGTIKTQGSHSLKAIAKQTYSLNETLTRSGASIDLSGMATIKFDIYASRTGANIKIGIHDSGGTTTEKTYTVLSANTWETAEWDISGVSNANKDAIDSIIITIINADADNIFYIDNMYTEEAAVINTLFFGSNF